MTGFFDGGGIEVNDKRTHAHDQFQPDVQVQVFRDAQAKGVSLGFMVSIAMSCLGCGETFHWKGLQTGQSFTAPRVTPDGKRLLAPFVPDSFQEMAVEKLPDIKPDEGEEDRIHSAIRRALMAPAAYAIQVEGESKVEFRARAILNAVQSVK